MQVETTTIEVKKFNPVVLHVTFESQEELDLMEVLMQHNGTVPYALGDGIASSDTVLLGQGRSKLSTLMGEIYQAIHQVGAEWWAGTAKLEAERAAMLSQPKNLEYMKVQAALNISEGIRDGKVNTIVVPSNLTMLGSLGK